MTEQKKNEQKVAGHFSPAELLPQTGNPSPVPYTTEQERAAKRIWDASLRSIYVQNHNHRRVFTALDNVLTLGVKGEYQTGVRNSAPSYAGKSASADAFARIVTGRGTYPAGTVPVLRVELEQACTSKRFWTAILGKYGDGFAASKDEDALRRSAYDAFEKHGTQLVIIDEVQHAGYRSAGSSAATDVIKRFISDRQVGIGLFGNEEAKLLLEGNNQLSHRLEDPCDIQPLPLTDTAAQATFKKFVKTYDAQLIKKQVFNCSSDLADERVINCLMAISKGYLGRVVKLLQVAARHAHSRRATRIEPCDLSHATLRWAMGQGLIGYNPFTFGVQKSDG